jgi:TRAP-type C4-dicarboxylate transport system permease large subunit
MYLVSGISGSKAADMAAVAPALFPEIIKRGAAPDDLVALLSATGGLLPSLVLAVGLCLVVRQRYRNQDMSGIRRATIAEVARRWNTPPTWRSAPPQRSAHSMSNWSASWC